MKRELHRGGLLAQYLARAHRCSPCVTSRDRVMPPTPIQRRPDDRRAQPVRARGRAANTLRAYESDLRHFQSWCQSRRFWLPTTPEAAALYIAQLADAGIKPSTIRRRLSSIAEVHRLAGFPSPADAELVRLAMIEIRRRHGVAPAQKAALSTADLMRLLATTSPVTAAGARDRAVLLLGFAGGFRRSELVALDLEDIHVSDRTAGLGPPKQDESGGRRS